MNCIVPRPAPSRSDVVRNVERVGSRQLCKVDNIVKNKMTMNRKCLFFLTLFFVGLSAKGQSYDDSPVFEGNIKSIVEKSVKYPDSWREFDFDYFHQLKTKRYFTENNLMQTETWEYIENDSLLIVKNRIFSGFSISFFVNKIYFDSNRRPKRHEIFYSQNNSIDTTILKTIYTDFVFNENDVMQFKRITINNGDTTAIELYEKQYINKRLSVAVSKMTYSDKEITSYTQTMKYDKKGNLKSKIIDYNNPEIVLGGAITWTRWRHDKYRIDYKKYDKRGNWTERYAVTWLKKYKIEVRVIEYD